MNIPDDVIDRCDLNAYAACIRAGLTDAWARKLSDRMVTPDVVVDRKPEVTLTTGEPHAPR